MKKLNVQREAVILAARQIYAGMELLVFTLWKALHLIELIEPPAVPTSPAGPAYQDLRPTPAAIKKKKYISRTGQSGSKPKCLRARKKRTTLFLLPMSWSLSSCLTPTLCLFNETRK